MEITFPELTIVIINHNLKNDTAECIDSFVGAGASLEQILLVDNASDDGSVKFLQEKFGQQLGIIACPENLGYAYGLNQGIKKGLERDAKWFLLMNNDTIVAPDFLTELRKATQVGTEYALFGPMIYYYSIPDRIWFLGDRLIPGTLISTRLYRGKEGIKDLPFLVPVDFTHGCGMLVKRDVFETVGLFDDWSIIYGEEVDFIWRARLANFRAAGIPSAKMWHKISAFMKSQPPNLRYLRIRNQIRFYRHYARGLQIPVMFTFTIVRALIIGILDLIKKQSQLIGPLIRGWIDGWLGRDNKPKIIKQI